MHLSKRQKSIFDRINKYLISIGYDFGLKIVKNRIMRTNAGELLLWFGCNDNTTITEDFAIFLKYISWFESFAMIKDSQNLDEWEIRLDLLGI